MSWIGRALSSVSQYCERRPPSLFVLGLKGYKAD